MTSLWLSLLAVLRLSAVPADLDKAEAGPFNVGVVEQVVLHNAVRDKDLPIKVYYPAADGPFPVIVWSHGAGGSKDGYEAYGRHWASHGYVCLHPSHADSLQLLRQNGERRRLADIVPDALNNVEGWVKRPKDVTFLLDSLAALPDQVPVLKGKLDVDRIGVGGHSFGAFTSQVIGGAEIQLPGHDGLQSFADERVKAVVLMSPQGPGQMGLTEDSWQHFTSPAMVLTGGHDRGAKGQDPEWRSQPFYRSPAGDKYRVFIESADHMTFARAFGRASLPDATRETILSSTTAFWDAYLKDDAEAKAFLASDRLAETEGVSFARR